MKKLFFIFAAVLLLFSGIANAEIIWNDNLMWWNTDSFVWLQNNAAAGKTATIDNGQSISFNSGSFASQIGEKIHAVAELVDKTGKITQVTAKEFTITNGGYTPYFTGTVSQTQYKKLGTYSLRITLSVSGEEDLIDYITLNVQEPVQSTNHNPVAQFTFTPANPNVNQVVSFISTSSDVDGDTLTYSWDFKDGSTSTLQNPNHKFTKDGSNAVSLTVTDELGLTDTVTHTINVDKTTVANTCPANVDFTFSPNTPIVGEVVTFTASATDAENNALTYSWNLDSDAAPEATGKTVSAQFSEAKTYKVSLTVNDGNCDTVASKNVVVSKSELEVASISCFNTVVVDHPQSCSVEVKANSLPVSFATAKLYYINGQYLGSCQTSLAGKCQVKFTETSIGMKKVTATAEKTGYLPDLSKSVVSTYVVLDEKYDILNLETYASYSDMVANNPDHTFYRGEPIYIKFQVEDMNTNAWVTDPNVITEAWLVSSAGGKASLTKLQAPANWYYYKLDLIPLNHEFFGESQAFAFAFNFVDQTGGEEYVDLTILNNPPQIFGMPTLIKVPPTTLLNLEPFESDKEDNLAVGADGMSWEILSVTGTLFTADVVGKELHIQPIAGVSGHEQVTLRLHDLDTLNGLDMNYAEQLVMVSVNEGSLFETAIIASPSTGNAPLTVAFTTHTEGGVGPFTYEWNLGDNSGVVTDKSTVHTYQFPGQYLVSLKITDFLGNIAEDTAVITVISPTLTADILINGVSQDSVSGNAPLNVGFSSLVNGAIGAVTYQWTVANSVQTVYTSPASTTLSSLNYIFGAAGTYTVTLQVTDSTGKSANDFVTVNVDPSSTVFSVNIVATTTGGGAPLTVGFVADVSGAAGQLTFDWSIIGPNGQPIFPADQGEEMISKQQGFTYTFTELGDYIVSIVVTDEFGNMVSDHLVIHVETEQGVAVVIKAVPQSGHAPLEVEFTAEVLSGNAPFTYSWDLGDGAASDKSSFKHVFEKEGVYEVTLTVTDGDGDTGTATVTINVKDTKTPVTSRKVVEWTNLKLLGGETYAPGDMVELLVNFKNEANWDLENVKITSIIPELGVKKSAGPFDLDEGDETTKILYLQLPYDAPQGEYDIRVVINNDGDDKIHRIKHRKITIE
ncbi:PKD domain-containing protein [Candidatus Woesearchaeota archaeon]|nr:PKD domain-containing protein [Candidatus Woesearchaeota archaeon]